MVEPLRLVSGLNTSYVNERVDDTPTSEDALDPASEQDTGVLPGSECRHRMIPHDPSSVFAKLIKGQIPSWKFCDTSTAIASLTPFPSSPGAMCIIPRQHWYSDILALPPTAFEQLMKDSWETIEIVKKAYGVKRCAVFFEGYEINWAHVKVWPIWESGSCALLSKDERLEHQRKNTPAAGEPWGGDVKFGFQEIYEGYVTSQPGDRVTTEREEELQAVAQEVRGSLRAAMGDA